MCKLVSQQEIVSLYKRFCQLDRNAKGFISADEFLSVPEFAMNPLSQVLHWNFVLVPSFNLEIESAWLCVCVLVLSVMPLGRRYLSFPVFFFSVCSRWLMAWILRILWLSCQHSVLKLVCTIRLNVSASLAAASSFCWFCLGLRVLVKNHYLEHQRSLAIIFMAVSGSEVWCLSLKVNNFHTFLLRSHQTF